MNSLIYRTPFYVNIYVSYKQSGFWPTLYKAVDKSTFGGTVYRCYQG